MMGKMGDKQVRTAKEQAAYEQATLTKSQQALAQLKRRYNDRSHVNDYGNARCILGDCSARNDKLANFAVTLKTNV